MWVCVFKPVKSEWGDGRWEVKGAPENHPCGLEACPLRILGPTRQPRWAWSEATPLDCFRSSHWWRCNGQYSVCSPGGDGGVMSSRTGLEL